MHRFFCPGLSPDFAVYDLPEGEAVHAARVLRLAPGDTCELLNGRGGIAEAAIAQVDKRHVSCRVTAWRDVMPPARSLRLYIAPPKGKNMELLLKMSAELGVQRVTPILCKYGVARPDEKKDSWTDTLIAACKQSGNPWLPDVDAPLPFSDAVALSQECSFVGTVPSREEPWHCWQENDTSSSLALWIGPEGGFAFEEEQALREHGAIPLTIGPWILRVETAVPALLGAIWQLLSKRG